MGNKIIKSKAVITVDMLSNTDTTIDELLSKDVCEAQIEQMAKDIVRMAGLAVYSKAEYLINLGYRKIPEGSVVLSTEELSKYTETLEHKIDQLNAKLDQERKEFAKTILMAGEKYADVFQGNFAWFLAWIRTKFGLESGVEE